MDVVNDLPAGPPSITGLESPLTSKAVLNSRKKRKKARKKKQGNDAENKDKGPDFSLENCSMEIDTSIKDTSPESHALPNLLSSQRNVEFDSIVKKTERKKKKRKRQKTENNAIESNVNGCGTPENTLSSETTTPCLDQPLERPIECMSTDSVTRESCVEADICHRENEEKTQNILKKATESSNQQCDDLEVSCYPNSAVVNAEFSAKEHVLEVAKFKLEHDVNDHRSKADETSGSVENESMVKKHDEDPEANHFSDKFQVGETYTRRKMVDSNYGRSSDHLSPENSNEEPTVKDHHKDDGSHKFSDGPLTVSARRKAVNSDCERSSGYPSPEICDKEPTVLDHHRDDDSHKFSDGPLAVGLMERETKLSRDQVTSDSGAAAEEMKLMTEKTSENSVMNTSSVVDIPAVHLEEKNSRQLDRTETTRNDLCCAGDVSDSNLVTIKDGHSKISKFSLGRAIACNSKKKLLILDVNGLLADVVIPDSSRYQPEPDFWLPKKKVYKRPYCDDFLQFCFDRFHVGVWSSRAKVNVDLAVKFLMGKSASKLLFCWNQFHCTRTNFSTVENRDKPLVLKELSKLWEKKDRRLPWEKGEFNETNTLLLDDSPYKALLNPMHTGVFPYTYRYYHTRDSSLARGGDLRNYLEGLAKAENVQEYVSSNPFGQRPIRETNPSWRYYQKVIEAVRGSQSEDAKPSSTVSEPRPDCDAPRPDCNAPRPDSNAPRPDCNAPRPDSNAPPPDSNAPPPDCNVPPPDCRIM